MFDDRLVGKSRALYQFFRIADHGSPDDKITPPFPLQSLKSTRHYTRKYSYKWTEAATPVNYICINIWILYTHATAGRGNHCIRVRTRDTSWPRLEWISSATAAGGRRGEVEIKAVVFGVIGRYSSNRKGPVDERFFWVGVREVSGRQRAICVCRQ